MLEEQEINRKLDLRMEMERLKAIENYEVFCGVWIEALCWSLWFSWYLV